MSNPVPTWNDRLIEIRRMRVGEIAGHARNPKIHPPRQRDALSDILAAMGKADVLKAYYSERNDGALTLYDGHARQSLDPDQEWPVAIFDLTDAEADDWLRYADPIAALAETDTAVLDALLRDASTDSTLLAELLSERGAAAGLFPDAPDTTEDDAPVEIDEEQPTRCQVGDVWRVGDHLIACLDSTDRANIERVVAGRKVGMVWADPPYGIEITATNVPVGGGEAYDIPFGGVKQRSGDVGGSAAHMRKTGKPYIATKGLGTANGAKPFGSNVRGSVGAANMIDVGKYMPVIGDETTETAEQAALLCLDLYPKATQVWWGANYYAPALPPSSCWVVWDKENTGNFADAELAWCSDKSAVRIFKHMWNGLMKASERGQRRTHPTQKPVALCLWAFEKYGAAGDVILDPFLGSGPSLKAAHRLGDRTVIGFELSPHYCDHVIEWAETQGLACEKLV